MKIQTLTVAVIAAAAITSSHAALVDYGDRDVLGTAVYGSNPTAGATTSGLLPNQVTYASLITAHGFPFAPSGGDHAGTDQIYVGAAQTAFHDGYSQYSGRIAAPHVITLDYSAQVPANQQILTFTLGIAADDFQRPLFGQSFSASINGVVNNTLTGVLNGLNQTGPRVQYFTIGLDPSALAANNILTISIDQGGDGGDGWAVDFLTTDVTTAPVPEPSTYLAGALLALVCGVQGFRTLRSRKLTA